VDVLAPVDAGTVVTLGDSITDGDQSTPNTNGMWPAVLAERLQANRATARIGVVNAGISGNRLLGDGSSGLVRLFRDALDQPGIKWLMLLEGINDITGATRESGTSAITADDLIAGYRQVIEAAHARGVKVIGCTITPYGGSTAYRDAGEAMREAVNRWVRTRGAFDAVVDFDAATRDANDPKRFRAEVDSPDLLHPANAGYKLMANAIDLSIFSDTPGKPQSGSAGPGVHAEDDPRDQSTGRYADPSFPHRSQYLERWQCGTGLRQVWAVDARTRSSRRCRVHRSDQSRSRPV
jgi:lysophospholipase L1-like esterase